MRGACEERVAREVTLLKPAAFRELSVRARVRLQGWATVETWRMDWARFIPSSATYSIGRLWSGRVGNWECAPRALRLDGGVGQLCCNCQENGDDGGAKNSRGHGGCLERRRSAAAAAKAAATRLQSSRGRNKSGRASACGRAASIDARPQESSSFLSVSTQNPLFIRA